MPGEFSIERQNAPNGVAILGVKGFLDAHTFEQLEEAIDGLFAEGVFRIVVDLAGVDYISSAGAGVFIGALSQCTEHSGNIILLRPTESVQEVFDLLGLSQIFTIAKDPNAAFAAF